MDDRMIPLSVLREYMPKLKDEDLKELGPVEYDQSKVPEVSKKHAENVRRKVYLPDMTESFARGVEYASLIASEAVDISNETKGRQDNVETQFNSVQQELTDKDPISAPEIIAARNGEPTLSDRLDKDHQNVTAQLAHTDQKIKSIKAEDMGVMVNTGVDQSETINAVIDYAHENGIPDIYLPKGVMYIDGVKDSISGRGGIVLKSNINLILDEETVLKVVPNSSRFYSIIAINDCVNTTVTGGTLIGDRHAHTGSEGEWGFGIQVVSSKNVKISNVESREHWGDGFYTRYSEKLTVANCLADYNRRQGISIVGGKEIRVYDSSFINTQGTLPESGADVEPSTTDDVVNNISFVNCYFGNNTGFGLVLYSVGGEFKDIFISRCEMIDNRVDFRLTGQNNIEDVVIEYSKMHFADVGFHISGIKDNTGLEFYRNEIGTFQMRRTKNSFIYSNTIKERMLFIDYIENVTVKDNIFLDSDVERRFDISNGTINGTVNNVEFSNNTIIGGLIAILLTNLNTNISIKGNRVYNTTSEVTTFSIEGRNVIIEGNLLINVKSNIRILGQSSNVLAANNMVNSLNDYDPVGGSGITNEGVVLYNNVKWN